MINVKIYYTIKVEEIQMLNIIVGKGSNLSKELAKNLDNSILISSLKVEDELRALDIDESINIIFNNFQVSTKLNDYLIQKSILNASIMTTAKVLDFI